MANNYCIYMHKNKINNKVYIGQSCNIKVRWHPISYKSSSYFYNAIEKYGWNNFEHIILEDNLSLEEADKKEKYYIKLYDSVSRDKGYNLKNSAPISRCCKGERKTAGKHPLTGERLKWSFYELKEENNYE